MTRSIVSKRHRRRFRGKLIAIMAVAAGSTRRAEAAIDAYSVQHDIIMKRIAAINESHKRRMDDAGLSGDMRLGAASLE